MRIDFSDVLAPEPFEREECVREAGRKREWIHPRELKKQLSTKTGRVPHRKRPSVGSSDGVLVTWKLKDGIPSLRQKGVMRGLLAVKHAVRCALQNARKHGVPIPKNTWDSFSSARFNMCPAGSAKELWPVVRADPFDLVYHGMRLLKPNDYSGLRRRFNC